MDEKSTISSKTGIETMIWHMKSPDSKQKNKIRAIHITLAIEEK